jgi:hypothetical protein
MASANTNPGNARRARIPRIRMPSSTLLGIPAGLRLALELCMQTHLGHLQVNVAADHLVLSRPVRVP